MSHYYALPLVNAAELDGARKMLGDGITRILGYFREDGAKAILQIETAMARRNAAIMVIPAHTLKGESRQFGAVRLAEIAEAIEMEARGCVERQAEPDDIATEVAMLRSCFAETISVLAPSAPAPVTEQRMAPPAQGVARFGSARPTFGRRQS